jgi:hypothetical protein
MRAQWRGAGVTTAAGIPAAINDSCCGEVDESAHHLEG